jgi:hypothetical protein
VKSGGLCERETRPRWCKPALSQRDLSALRVTEKGGKRYLVIDATKQTLTSAPGYQYDTATGKWVPEAKTP